MLSIGILGSTRGSALPGIYQAMVDDKLAAQISLVVSNKADALILSKAQSLGLTATFANPGALSREAYDSVLTQLFLSAQVELIVLIGYMRILSAGFVTAWRDRILNIHPSLLPDFAGGMDLEVHRAVLAAGVKETGCTVHVVNEIVDGGPILVQKKCAVYASDTPELLKARVQALEQTALIEAIHKFAIKK